MIVSGHILIVDDDWEFLQMYSEIFKSAGLQVSTATSAIQAIAELDLNGPSLDVVLIDQKLQGCDGPDGGLELMAEVGQRAPFAKSIIITSFAARPAAERAFHAGAHDYIVKNVVFEPVLRARVQSAVEVTRAKRQLAIKESIGLELRAMLLQTRVETDRSRRGKFLEDLICLLFQSIPEFGRVTTQLTNGSEEISIVVENRSSELPWKDEGAYLVGVCKNWSSTCGAAEVRDFRRRLTAKYRRVRTGFLIAPGGFSTDAYEEARSHKEGKLLIILIDDADLERWITAEDRLAVLGAFHERAVFDLKLS